MRRVVFGFVSVAAMLAGTAVAQESGPYKVLKVEKAREDLFP